MLRVTCAAAAGECGRALRGVQGGGRPLRHRDVDLRRLPRHIDGLLLHRRPIPGVSTRLDLAWRYFRLASAQASALRSGGSAGRRRTGDGRAPRFRSGGRHASRTQAWRKRLCNERRICPFYQFFRKLCSFNPILAPRPGAGVGVMMRRLLLALACTHLVGRSAGAVFRPEAYGAKGDGERSSEPSVLDLPTPPRWLGLGLPLLAARATA